VLTIQNVFSERSPHRFAFAAASLGSQFLFLRSLRSFAAIPIFVLTFAPLRLCVRFFRHFPYR
jgi:hypothetical protein